MAIDEETSNAVLEALPDRRQATKVFHTIRELVIRIFGLEMKKESI